MAVDATAVRFVVLPATEVHVSVSMDKSTLSVGFIIAPVTFIHRAIGPYLHATPLTSVTANEPFALVSGSIFEHLLVAIFTLAETSLIVEIVVYEVAELLALIQHVRVVVVLL
jgi:hypothetical protein